MAKKSFKPDYNACIGNNKHENFGSIYESMVKSEQFKALSSPARMLYVLCRIQHKSGAGKACLHNHSEEFGVKYPDSCFVFPAKRRIRIRITTNKFTKILQRTNRERIYRKI